MISVILPHFNQPASLRRALQVLVPQAKAHEAEVIVVDNGSRPDQHADAVIADFSTVRLLHQPEPGPGPARNLGAAYAGGDLLAFLDADCLPAEDWLDAIQSGFNAGAQVLGGDVRILIETPDNPSVWEAFESEYGYRNQLYIRDKDFVATCNIAIRREVFQAVGGFAGIDVAEDLDWGHRATTAGYHLTWAPLMRAFHPARNSYAESARKWDRMTAHDYAHITAKPLGRLRWIARTVAMGISPVAELPRILRSDRITGGTRGRLRAFVGVVRTRLYRTQIMTALAMGRSPQDLANRWRDSD